MADCASQAASVVADLISEVAADACNSLGVITLH